MDLLMNQHPGYFGAGREPYLAKVSYDRHSTSSRTFHGLGSLFNEELAFLHPKLELEHKPFIQPTAWCDCRQHFLGNAQGKIAGVKTLQGCKQIYFEFSL